MLFESEGRVSREEINLQSTVRQYHSLNKGSLEKEIQSLSADLRSFKSSYPAIVPVLEREDIITETVHFVKILRADLPIDTVTIERSHMDPDNLPVYAVTEVRFIQKAPTLKKNSWATTER